MTFRFAFPTLLMIAAIGCSASETAPDAVIQRNAQNVVENGIREAATVRIDSSGVRTLVATLTLENLGATDRPILWGQDCLGNGPLDARMYRGSTLVWESSRSRPLVGCPVRAIQSAITAGGSVSFAWQLPIKTILGDSLAAGTYSLAVHPTLALPELSAELSAGDLTVADPIAVPPGTNLNGTWTGSSGGLSVSLALTWTADSVHGAGTYSVSSAASGTCRAPESGPRTMSLVAVRQGDVVQGHLQFGADYGPPYLGRLSSADRFEGTILAIDTPGCPLVLTRAK